MDHLLGNEVGEEPLGQELLKDRHGDSVPEAAGLVDLRGGYDAVGRGDEVSPGKDDRRVDHLDTEGCRRRLRDADCRRTRDWR